MEKPYLIYGLPYTNIVHANKNAQQVVKVRDFEKTDHQIFFWIFKKLP